METRNAPSLPDDAEAEGHPYSEDLRPNHLAGDNYGLRGPHPEKTARSAYDVKDVHDLLQDFGDDELKQIPIMPPGSRLEQGATYLDLHRPRPEELTATGDMVATEETWYVPKSEV